MTPWNQEPPQHVRTAGGQPATAAGLDSCALRSLMRNELPEPPATHNPPAPASTCSRKSSATATEAPSWSIKMTKLTKANDTRPETLPLTLTTASPLR